MLKSRSATWPARRTGVALGNSITRPADSSRFSASCSGASGAAVDRSRCSNRWLGVCVSGRLASTETFSFRRLLEAGFPGQVLE